MSKKTITAALFICLVCVFAFGGWYAFRMRAIAMEAKSQLTSLTAQLRDAIAENVRLMGLIPPPEPISDSWKLVTDDAAFEARDGAFAASFHGYIWLANGWSHTPFKNSIWRSRDGETWEAVVDEAPWRIRHLGNFLVHEDRLWMLGGDYETDVWSSSDGTNWRRETASAPWGGRYNPYVGAFDGRIWVMGGLDEGYRPLRDVWSSTDGVHWQLVTSEADWPARGLISGFAVHDGAMWIMGGGAKVVNPAFETIKAETIVEYSDVWRSEDGADWELVNARAPWLARTHLSVASFDGQLLVTDGSVNTQGVLSNEAWASGNGIEWAPVGGTPKQNWEPRHASSLVNHNGALFLIGGYLSNDVWRLDQVFTSSRITQ